jgi:hypothetical protein
MAASVKSLFPVSQVKGFRDMKVRQVVCKLPESYQKFYGEWKDEEGTPVHWVPSKVKWERNPETGEV